MSEIKSSIGSVGVGANQSPNKNRGGLKHFVVDDALGQEQDVREYTAGFSATSTDFDTSGFENFPENSGRVVNHVPDGYRKISTQEFNDIRENLIRAHGKRAQNTFSNQKSLIEKLIGIGTEYEDVVVGSQFSDRKTVFRIKTLSSREKACVTRAHANVQLSSDADKVGAIIEARDTTLVYAIQAIDGISIDDLLNCSSSPENDRAFIRGEFISSLDNNLLNYLYNKFMVLEKKGEKFYLDNLKTSEEVADAMKKSQ